MPARRVLVPPTMRGAEAAMSPGLAAGGFVFVTGMTGSGEDGAMPHDPAEQFFAAFDKIAAVLREDGLTLADVVETTTYHVGLRDHFDTFDAVRRRCLRAPYPAWTAVEVAGLRRPGALVEIRAVALRAGLCGAA